MAEDEIKFIDYDFKLPVHANELSKAEEVLDKLKDKITLIKSTKSINDKIHTKLFDEIIRVLDYVGQLSVSAFNVAEEMERMYTMQYLQQPALGKKLWLDHYEHIHHPYTILKNRCFRMLDDLDDEFIRRFKRKPPNWKI